VDDPAVGLEGVYDRRVTECQLIRGGAGFHGKQGLDYFSGVSAESTGQR